MNVAIVYHFFANYRKPIFDELSNHDKLNFLFVADRVNRIVPGLEIWQPNSKNQFRHARCFPLGGGVIFQMGMIRLAWSRDVDCIIFLGDWKFPSTWIGAILARLRGKRVLFWTQGWRKHDHGLKRKIRNAFYSLAHGMLLYGNWAREIAIQQGFKAESLHVVFNSLDHQKHVQLREQYSEENINKTRSELFGSTNIPVVICSARLHKRKRLHELILAANELRKQSHPINIILIGDGAEKPALEKLAKEHEVNVHFEGSCYDERRIAELTMASNLTVSPGPVGLTVIQSHVFGVPVVSNNDLGTQGPECEAIVPGVTGDLFANADIYDLTRKIKKWTSTQFVPSEVRENCIQIIDSYYNPIYQATVFHDAVVGNPAETSF